MNQTGTVTVREQVSALADGDLQGAELAEVVGQICADDDLRGAWHTYHLVGDVLRSGAQAPCAESAGFVARFQQRLAAETPVVAVAPARPVAPAVHAGSVVAQPVEAANEPVFRWKLVAGAASLAAAAAIGWNLLGSGTVSPAPAAQLAQQQETPSVLAASRAIASEGASRLSPTRVVVGGGGAPQVMLRDPRLDQLLEAHQQAGGASQMPSGFLRNATFEGAGR